MIRRAFGLALRDLRRRVGLSQEELAAKAKTSPGQISKMEHGKTDPRLTTVDRYLKLLNVSYHTFCSEIERHMEELGLPPRDGIDFEQEMLAGGILSISRSGYLDISRAGPFVKAVFALGKEKGARKILFDLSAAECRFSNPEEYRGATEAVRWLRENDYWPIVAVIANSTLGEFGPEVARDLGHKVELFRSKPQGHQWLKEQP